MTDKSTSVSNQNGKWGRCALNRVEQSEKQSSWGSVTYYFNHHEDGRDASDERQVYHGGDVSGQPLQSAPHLVGLGWAGLRVDLGWEVCHDHTACVRTCVPQTAAPTAKSSKKKIPLWNNDSCSPPDSFQSSKTACTLRFNAHWLYPGVVEAK